jgi:hypothetical protein
MGAPAQDRLEAFLHGSDRSVWSTAALILALDGSGSAELQRGAADVLRALDLALDDESLDPARLAAQGAAPVHQVAALLRGDGQIWAGQSDEALFAQGRASGRFAAALAEHGLPRLAGLAEAFATPGTRMLDVGTGVAGLAVSCAEEFPALTVVGIDVSPRVLALAAHTVAASSVGERVVLREQDVNTLDEPNTYAFAWMPAPFLPVDALSAGVLRVIDALVPGGWLVLGHGKFAGGTAEVAVNRFKTIAYGGTALDDEEAEEFLHSAHLVDVMTMPTPAGSPALTLGRKSAAD